MQFPANAIDPVGMWYVARERHGIADPVFYGIATRDADGTESFRWLTVPHREADGIGALQRLLAARGYRGGVTPLCRERTLPSLAQLFTGWRQSRQLPAAAKASWRNIDMQRLAQPHTAAPQHAFLTVDEKRQAQTAARAAGTSLTTWLLWTLDRAARRTLAEPDAVLPWLYPVNLRGAVQVPSPEMNQCGGLRVQVAADTSAADVTRQIRERFAAQEHWRSWLLLNLGRRIGQRGVNLLYDLARDRPGSWAGSWTNLGQWPLPGMSRPAGEGRISGVICCAPGSPAYPVSAGVLAWEGRLALACRVHPLVDPDGSGASRLLTAWRAATGAG